jgi:tubulin polyglutamylase TTLL6/13
MKLEDVYFCGTYEDSDAEYDDGEDSGSEEESPLRGRRREEPARAKPVGNRIVMNVSDTQYPVVKFVGKKILKWKLQYDGDNWDLFWTDNAV